MSKEKEKGDEKGEERVRKESRKRRKITRNEGKVKTEYEEDTDAKERAPLGMRLQQREKQFDGCSEINNRNTRNKIKRRRRVVVKEKENVCV